MASENLSKHIHCFTHARIHAYTHTHTNSMHYPFCTVWATHARYLLGGYSQEDASHTHADVYYQDCYSLQTLNTKSTVSGHKVKLCSFSMHPFPIIPQGIKTGPQKRASCLSTNTTLSIHHLLARSFDLASLFLKNVLLSFMIHISSF